jgi:hypothetical protein
MKNTLMMLVALFLAAPAFAGGDANRVFYCHLECNGQAVYLQQYVSNNGFVAVDTYLSGILKTHNDFVNSVASIEFGVGSPLEREIRQRCFPDNTEGFTMYGLVVKKMPKVTRCTTASPN